MLLPFGRDPVPAAALNPGVSPFGLFHRRNDVGGVPRHPGCARPADRLQAAGHGAGGPGQGERRDGHPRVRRALPATTDLRAGCRASGLHRAGYAEADLPVVAQGSGTALCGHRLQSRRRNGLPAPVCLAARYEGDVYKMQSASNNSWAPAAAITGEEALDWPGVLVSGALASQQQFQTRKNRVSLPSLPGLSAPLLLSSSLCALPPFSPASHSPPPSFKNASTQYMVGCHPPPQTSSAGPLYRVWSYQWLPQRTSPLFSAFNSTAVIICPNDSIVTRAYPE